MECMSDDKIGGRNVFDEAIAGLETCRAELIELTTDQACAVTAGVCKIIRCNR